MSDNSTGLPVKIADGATPTQLAAVDSSGRLSTNIGAYGGTATTLGSKVSASSMPVVIASDQGAVAISTTALVPGTAATNLGKAEDAAHSSGDTGVFVLAVRNDAGTALAGTDGDYIPFSTDNTGALRVTGGSAGTQYVGDAAATATPTGTLAMGLANAAAPSDVSANNDAVAQWMLRNGSTVVNLASGGTLITIGSKVSASSIPVVIASDQGAFPVTVSGVATAANQTNVQVVDNAGFTDGTTTLLMGGYIFDEVAGTSLTENDAAAARVNANRAQVMVIEDSATRGQRLAVSAAGAMAANLTQVGGSTHSATVPLFARLTDGTAVYSKTGQTAGTAAFAQLSDQTTAVAVIVGVASLKTDLSSVAGAVPSATNPVPVRLTDGAAFYAAASGAPTLPKFSAKTSSALGAGSSVDLTHYVTSGKTGHLAGVDVTSTVPLRVAVNTEVTASKTVRAIFFTQPYTVCQWRTPFKTYITQTSADATSGFSVTIKNMDSAVAADVYSTGYWDEV